MGHPLNNKANLTNGTNYLPYHLELAGAGVGNNVGINTVQPIGSSSAIQIQSLDPSSDCNAGTVDADNLFSIRFVPDNTGLITAGTYADTVTFTVSSV